MVSFPNPRGGLKPIGVAAWIGLGLVAAWLLYPALTPAHVEGFSASIESLALHLGHEGVNAFDRLQPFDTTYFWLTRLGTDLSVAGFIEMFHVGGVTAFRLTMWTGLIAFLVGSLILIRRWAQCGLLAGACVLLLMPGVAESAFFYNDNVLSAGLGVIALVLLAIVPELWAAACAGLLLGFAVISRTDLVLITPAVPLILVQKLGWWRGFWLNGIACGLVFLATLVLGFAAFHTSLLQVLHIANRAISLWSRTPSKRHHCIEVIRYVGLPVLFLLPFGIVDLVMKRRWLLLALVVVTPILFNIAEFGNVWEARQLLPLTPFVGAIGARGLTYLIRFNQGSMERLLRNAILILAAIVLVLPPFKLVLDDGPRSYFGRLWMPVIWRRWQSSVEGDFSTLHRLIASAPPGRLTAVLTEDWNPDRFLHVALQESGYRELPVEDAGAGCLHAGELFERNGRRILHIRLEEPFVPASPAFSLDRLQRFAAPCLAGARASATYMITSVGREGQILNNVVPRAGDADPAQPATSKDFPPSAAKFTALVITPALLDHLTGYYKRQQAAFWADHRSNPVKIVSLDAAERELAK